MKKLFAVCSLLFAVCCYSNAIQITTIVNNPSNHDICLRVFDNNGGYKDLEVTSEETEKSFDYDFELGYKYNLIWKGEDGGTCRDFSTLPLKSVTAGNPGYGSNVPYSSKELPIKIDKKDFKHIEKILFEQYGGKDELKPFKKEFKKIKTLEDLQNFLIAHINDYHFSFQYKDPKAWNINGGEHYVTVQKDNPQIKSIDIVPTRKYIRTSNAEYYRNNDCKVDDEYKTTIELIKGDLDFIILDFRTNKGGGNTYQSELMNKLKQASYKGTIIVLQDNFSFSSGEAWCIVGNNYYSDLNTLLIGQHSGGMQTYGDCEEIEFNGFWFWLPTIKMTLPEKFEGEGRGYKPDIFVESNEQISLELKKLGVDLTGIIIQ
jgi:hypothetical protein